MSGQLGVIVAVDVEFEAAVVAKLAQARDVEVVARPADEIELIAVAAAGTGNVVVLGAYFPGVDAEVVRRLHGAGVAILGFGTDSTVFSQWGIAQISEPWADTAVLVEALRAALTAQPGPPKPQTRPAIGQLPPDSAANRAESGLHSDSGRQRMPGKIIAVWGTGSAPGRSTLAHSLAVRLARDFRTVLVDADTVRASQAVYLGIHADTPQLAHLVRHAESLTPDITAANVTELTSKLHVITGLARAERWPEIKPASLSLLLRHLVQGYQAVVVDIADRIDPDDDYADPHYDRHAATRVTLDAADVTLAVGAGDPVGLKLLVDLLASERARAADVLTVINKTRASAVGTQPEKTIASTLERFTGLSDPLFLPWAGADMDKAVLDGKALVEAQPKHPFSAAIDEIIARMPFETPPRRADTRPRAGRRRKIRV